MAPDYSAFDLEKSSLKITYTRVGWQGMAGCPKGQYLIENLSKICKFILY